MKANDLEIIINKADTSTKSGCEQVIGEAATLGAVGGIFNLNYVNENNRAIGLHSKSFKDCLKLKAAAYKNLDEVSRKLCPELQYFVAFSSVTSGRGNAGQSHFGMATSIVERIMEQRYRCGLPAKAIQWSLMRGGNLIDDDNIYDVFNNTNYSEIMDVFFGIDDPIVSCMNIVQ